MKKRLNAFLLIEFILLIYIATLSSVYAQESENVDPVKNVPVEQQSKDTPKAQGETVDPVKNVPVEQQSEDTPKAQGETVDSVKNVPVEQQPEDTPKAQGETVDSVKNVPVEQQSKDTPKAQGETVDSVKNVPVEQQPKGTPKAQGEIIADSDRYIIGPEDVLNIYVWREESLTKEKIPVRIDGKISLPLVDDIQAAGLTPLQLKAELTKRLKGFVDNPTVTVTVMEANSFKIYVSGEVKQPGIVRIRSEVTLVKLIIMVGGFTEWANKKKILIITREKDADKRITVNYNKIIDGKEPDIVIHRDDTVIVK